MYTLSPIVVLIVSLYSLSLLSLTYYIYTGLTTYTNANSDAAIVARYDRANISTCHMVI